MEQKTISRVSDRSCRRSKSGFTLLELIVVAVIIALLAGILIPVILRAQRSAKKIRTAADLQAIGVAPDAYKTDFGDYPRVDIPNTGFAVLCKALVGPGPAGGPLPGLPAAPYAIGTYTSTGTVGTGTYVEYVAFGEPDAQGGFSTSSVQSDATQWAPFPVSDGSNGPGFKTRFGGQPHNPYLQAEKFNVKGLTLFDVYDKPILYFPAAARKPAQVPNWPLLQIAPPLAAAGTASALYTVGDNLSFFLRFGESAAGNSANALRRMDAFMVTGSTDFNGVIGAGESAATTKDYLLWSCGQDGKFGVSSAGNPTLNDIDNCDDVTNFK